MAAEDSAMKGLGESARPRNTIFIWPAPAPTTVMEGEKRATSSRLWMPFFAISAALKDSTACGMSWMFSSRLRALTMTSSMPCCAMTGAARLPATAAETAWARARRRGWAE
jgi:hypothetical protein